MVLIGTGVFLMLELLLKNSPGHSLFWGYVTSVTITILVWEGNLRLDRVMDRRFPWHKNPARRLLLHLPASLVLSSTTIFISMNLFDRYACKIPGDKSGQFVVFAIVIGTLVSIILLSVEVGAQFFRNWKSSLVEVEKYKTQSLQAQLQNLKDQVNPHFMFNNLSVLSSLVYKDQDKAVDFINQLSKVYRYLLDSHTCELVELRDELAFIQSYTYLLQIRFDRNLSFHFRIPEDSEPLLLPPMALQILIENAIKHNEISEELPLRITILAQDDYLEVTNNLQLRLSGETGSKNGLANIRERYKFFTTRGVEIQNTGGTFLVRIPLLRSK